MTPPDWTNALGGEAGDALIETLRSLDLGQLHLYPLPKQSGTLPLGHEFQVARNFLRRESSTLFESAFSAAYVARGSERHRQLFDAFVLNHPVPTAAWSTLLGADVVERWRANGILFAPQNDTLRCAFRVVPVDGLVLLTDSPDAAPSGENAVSYVEGPMHYYLKRRVPQQSGAGLDVGPGAGLLTTDLAAKHDRALGLDLNPRAASVAAFNMRLNGIDNCEVRQQDIFDKSIEVGRFETVTWNTPLRFLPPELEDEIWMAYGGDMGIEITLRFLERLPSLLVGTGVAHVASAAPIMTDGSNFLLDKIRDRCAGLHLDARYQKTASFWGNPEHRAFYAHHGIDRFEGCWLEIRHGEGRVEIAPYPLVDAAVDGVRRLMRKLPR